MNEIIRDLDNVYSDLINLNCHESDILELIDELQNRIEDYFQNKEKSHE